MHQPTKKQRENKSVSFCSNRNIRIEDTVQDDTRTRMSDSILWYSRQDEYQFRVRDRRIIKMIQKYQGNMNLVDLRLSKDQDATRGLEYLARELQQPPSRRICRNKKNSSQKAQAVTQRAMSSRSIVMAVQQDESKAEDEVIARMYRLSCGMAKKDAELLAAHDESLVTNQTTFRPPLLGRQYGSRSLPKSKDSSSVGSANMNKPHLFRGHTI